jgi:hypothetical protein
VGTLIIPPMPSPIPERNRTVYFVGAGLSCALGMPNTAALITDVKRELEWTSWRHSANLDTDLKNAFKAFYPDGTDKGFTPDAVDFFSTLHSYVEVCAGYPGSLSDTAEFFRRLKFGIAYLLTRRLRDVDGRLAEGSDYLDQVVRPGNIVVTSNWDFGIEHYARLKGVPVRWRGHRDSELVVLKLHGSIDWTLGARARIEDFGADDYAMLNEQAFGPNHYRPALPADPEECDASVIRTRALEEWGQAWSRISSRTEEPYVVTMARGKSGELGPLLDIWREAYEALSRARRLEIVGYSLPDDDIEIRTLLRAAVRRGEGPRQIVVRNPAPDVHVRVRRFLRRTVDSDYMPVDAV